MTSFMEPLGFISNTDAQQIIGVLALIGGVALLPRDTLKRERTYFWNNVPLFLIPYVLGRVWLGWVNSTVQEPYLDEFFHIPQAQVYCDGRYNEWDDKITTPPGLYMASIPWTSLGRREMDCSAENLRAINVVAAALVGIIATTCRAYIEGTHDSTQRRSTFSIHTGINIALFPVLFFFSGLYYTDVMSTGAVLLAYKNHLWRISSSNSGTPIPIFNDVYTVYLGVLALFMRQTNVFWVVVYMGALEAVQSLNQLKPEPVQPPKFNSIAEQAQFYAHRYSLGEIHDPPLNLAWPDDLLLCIASIGIAVVYNLGHVLRRVYPHVVVLVLFIAFVAWNGGVVLGDKSNHIATLHLAQMLYIWPLFAFFSAPLLIPRGFRLLPTAWCMLVGASSANSAISSSQANNLATLRRLFCTLMFIIAIFIALMIVRFNTIIHPFTLADNRHYMFYIFRYTILRDNLIRYALAPIYVVCGWLCWSTLYGPGASEIEPQTAANEDLAGSKGSRKNLKVEQRHRVESDPPTTTLTASTVLILFLATTLSLVTAPLVEPRYFILPWVFWRLLVPAWPGAPISPLFKRVDARLVLETAWFLVVNAATMYIFITRPFYWRAADGTLLDEGKVQRFMW